MGIVRPNGEAEWPQPAGGGPIELTGRVTCLAEGLAAEVESDTPE